MRRRRKPLELARSRAVTAIVLYALFIVGCGWGNDLPLAPTRGSVTYLGEPLTRGDVVFTPMDGTRGPQAFGRIRSDGTFEMQTANRPGAVIGKHRIAVHCREQGTEEQQRDMAFKPKSLIPEKYSDTETSSLQIEIRAGGNDVPITLE